MRVLLLYFFIGVMGFVQAQCKKDFLVGIDGAFTKTNLFYTIDNRLEDDRAKQLLFNGEIFAGYFFANNLQLGAVLGNNFLRNDFYGNVHSTNQFYYGVLARYYLLNREKRIRFFIQGTIENYFVAHKTENEKKWLLVDITILPSISPALSLRLSKRAFLETSVRFTSLQFNIIDSEVTRGSTSTLAKVGFSYLLP